MYHRKLATKEDYDKWIKNTNILSARLLEPGVEGHFDMTSYFDHTGNHDIMKKDPVKILSDCNTTACAWGHGAAMPEFKDQGLSYEPGRNNSGDRVWEVNVTPWCTHDEKNNELPDEEDGDYDWGHYLFGCIRDDYGVISDETDHLFGGDTQRTPKKEAAVLQTHALRLERETKKKFG